MKNRIAENYRAIEVLTSDRRQIILTMYAEAIQSLRKALEISEISPRNRLVTRTFAIVQELHSSLDVATGGELAEKLGTLYRWICSALMRGQALEDKRLLGEVLDVLERLNEVWKEAVASVEER